MTTVSRSSAFPAVTPATGRLAIAPPEEPSPSGEGPAERNTKATSRERSFRTRTPLAERFFRHVTIDDIEKCWLWRGGKKKDGYGRTSFRFNSSRGPTTSAHAFAYELVIGPIPRGLVLDHLCNVPACVNPYHLRPTTDRENTLRSLLSPSAVNARKTHCVAGHELTGANVRIRQQQRGRVTSVFRECRRCPHIRRPRGGTVVRPHAGALAVALLVLSGCGAGADARIPRAPVLWVVAVVLFSAVLIEFFAGRYVLRTNRRRQEVMPSSASPEQSSEMRVPDRRLPGAGLSPETKSRRVNAGPEGEPKC